MSTKKTTHSGSLLDTLALSRTYNQTESLNNVEIINGLGACKDSVKKRPKRKLIDQSLCLALIDVCKVSGDVDWIQPYWNAYHCQTHLITYNGRAYGDYCKSRFCSICKSIRKANFINLYRPIVEKWKNPYFLTLTVKSQPRSNLKYWVSGMVKALQRIQDRCRKRNERGKGIKLRFIRSMECNFNPIRKTYNPHFHIITESEEVANVLKTEWIKTWNQKFEKSLNYKYYFTDPRAQDIRPIKTTEEDLIECIKYGAKIFTDPTMRKGKNKSTSPIIYAAALHEIHKAFKGHQLFTSCGFKLPEKENNKSSSKIICDFQNWEYKPEVRNWVNVQTGQVMTNFDINNKLESILIKINTEFM